MADINSTSTRTRSPRSVRRWLVAAGGGALGVVAVIAAGWLAWSYHTAPTLRAIERELNRHKYGDAERDAKAFLFWHRGDADGLFALAKARAGRGDVKGCAETLESLPKAARRYPEALFRAGQAYLELHRLRDAERAFRACVASDPDGQGYPMSARVELSALLALEERRDAFKAEAWETYDHVPEDKRLPVLTMMLRLDFEQARPEINAKALRAAVEADPGDADARAGLAAALDHQGNVAEARSAYAQALQQKSGDSELREKYMDLLRRMGEFDTLKRVLAGRRPDSDARPATQNLLGVVAEMSGDMRTAEKAFRAAVRLNPRDPEYHHRLSLVLYRLGQKEEATREAATRTRLRAAQTQLRQAWTLYANAFDVDPNQISTDLVLGMARAIEACDQEREAAAWFRQVLHRDPNEPTARAALEALHKRGGS